MEHTISWRAFSKYLKDNGLSEESESGNQSTTYDYPQRVERILGKEGLKDWDALGEHITELIEKYGPAGPEAEYGRQSHGSNLKALQLFMEFYVCFDANKTLEEEI